MNGCAAAILAMHLMVHGLGLGPGVHVPTAIESKPTVAAPFVPHQEGERTLCTLQAVNADMPTMLRVLSDQSHVGLVLLAPTDTKLTINLVNIPFIDALQHVCAMSSLSYLKVDSTFVVAAKDKLKDAYPVAYYAAHPDEKAAPEEVVTEVYTTNYVSSTQLVDSLGQLYPKDQLTMLAGPVQSNPSISTQDTTTSTGIESSALQKEDPTTIPSRTLVLHGAKSVVEQALELVKKMDIERPQVGIEVSIYDIDDTALNNIGVTWSYGDINIQETNPRGVNFGSFARAPLTFDGVVQALEEQDKAKLLASPNVSVLDGEHAFILIGDRINYPVLVGYSQNNAPIFSKEEERVGIYLQVAATVSSDDNVTLSLYPQVSTITGFLNVNGASYPQISTREAQTTLRVHSGETIIMGGLLKSEETATYDKVPLLSKLPFIGELFKYRKTNKDDSQVIISIKPKVIRPDESR